MFRSARWHSLNLDNMKKGDLISAKVWRRSMEVHHRISEETGNPE